MTPDEIEQEITAIEGDTTLFDERNFERRLETIDFIGFHLIAGIEELLQTSALRDQLMLLKHRVEIASIELEEFDRRLFEMLREQIRTGESTGQKLRELTGKYFDLNFGDTLPHEEPGFDALDIFVNGLLSFMEMPEQTKELEPEMVFYQKTPARIVFGLAERVNITNEDVFFDIGSGLGQAVILVNLLVGVTAVGIEFEPAFCKYGEDCAAALNLSNVSFVNTDARKADYSRGTVFFMYTPFSGEMLDEVLEILRKESLTRKIKIITYGPCSPQVAGQTWLVPGGPTGDNIYKLAEFSSK